MLWLQLRLQTQFRTMIMKLSQSAIHWCLENWSYNGHVLLCYFRSLICQLEEVNPAKLKHDEKLAFWINVHNALVMHVIINLQTMLCYPLIHFISLTWLIGLEFFLWFLIGFFSLWNSTKQCEKSLSSVKGKNQ